MPFTTGTSSDQNDLLNDLRVWLTTASPAPGWTELNWDPPGGGPATSALLNIRAPGSGAGREVFLNFQTRANAGLGAYGWACSGAVDYSSAAAWGAQPDESPECFLNTWDNSIDWWAYANDRRLILVAKISSYYMPLYAGFFLPFAVPDEYPFPLFIGGNYPSLAPYTDSNTINRFFIDPGDGCAHYKRRGSSSWRKVVNHYSGVGSVNVSGGTNAVMWPHRTTRAQQGGATEDWNLTQGIQSLRPNEDGELPHWQPHIIDPGMLEMPGGLDGVYAAPGFGRSSEQIVTIGATNYRLFQNINRATERDFMMIEEA